jgi:hypothetical protein
MRVVVITLAIPNPWGIRSLQRCHCDESSFHIITIILAPREHSADNSVSVYSFPVRRMILGNAMYEATDRK